jgi:hypothetical protein
MGRVSAELGRRIYLDINIVIYVVEGFAQYAAQVQALLDTITFIRFRRLHTVHRYP